MRLLSAIFLLLSVAIASAVAPGQVQGLTATAIANKDIQLSWTAPVVDETHPAATGYKVLRALTSAPTSTTDLTPTAITGLSFTDSSSALVAGTSYTYTVVAYNGAEGGTPSAPASATPLDVPGGPSNLRATRITSTSVSLAWNAVVGEDVTYTVYRDDEAVGEDLTDTVFTDTGLVEGEEYSYVVTATNDNGESPDSNEVTVTTGDGNGRPLMVRRFRQIDIDANGLLTLEEFIGGHGGRLAWVVVVHRFEYSDTDDSGDLSIPEYSKSIGGRKYGAPIKPRQFFLADVDANGALDPEEFSLTLGARTPWNKVVNIFNKKDKINPDDDYLSAFEFGIRTGSEDEPDDVVVPPAP